MARPISDMDHSVAFSCLLRLFPWYGEADSRDTGYVTERLVQEWREQVANGRSSNCYALAGEMEQELLDVLARAKAARLGK
jgi:hypothetical protein